MPPTEVWEGTVTHVDLSPMTQKATCRGECILADGRVVIVLWEVEMPSVKLGPGARFLAETGPGGNFVRNPVNKAESWPMKAMTTGVGDARPTTLTVRITAAMEDELARRAAAAHVGATLILDDMGRNVLVVTTPRGRIRRGIAGIDDWPAVLESVGLGDNLR